MIKEDDYNNIEGIKFLDLSLNFDINDSMNPNEIVDELAREFKEEINKIGISVTNNEDDKRFNHIRGHFASAVRLELTSHVPEEDEKYKLIKNKIGMGLEKYYYTHIVVPKLINEVYKKFFIDPNNKFLYSFQDDGDNHALDGSNSNSSEFNFMAWEMRIEKAINPSKRSPMDGILSGVTGLFKETWVDNYKERLGIIFNKIGMQQVQETNTSTQEALNIISIID